MENQAKKSALTTFIQHRAGILGSKIKQEEEMKQSLFVDGMIIYVENQDEFTKTSWT